VNTRSKGMRKVKVGQAIYLSTYMVAGYDSNDMPLGNNVFVRMLCGL